MDRKQGIMRRQLSIGLLAISTLAACGGDDRADTVSTATTVAEVTSTTAASAAAPSTTAEATTTTTAPPPPNRDEYVAALLTLEDLPFGFTVRPDPVEEEPAAPCEEIVAESLGRADEDLRANFQQTDLGPFVSHAFYLNDSDDAAAALLEALRVGIDGCRTFVSDDVEYSYSALSYPNIGDETFAARLGGVTFFGPVTVDVIVWREGSVIVGVVVGLIGDGYDPAFTESTVEQARAKLPG